MEVSKGRLLVATPLLLDVNFIRAVILMIEHNEDGGLGVVLNRPSETAVADPLPRWGAMAAVPSVVFIGGPVAPEVAICLGRLRPGFIDGPGLQPLDGDLATVDLGGEVDELTHRVSALRIFAGYAGWVGGQLEDEIDEGAWVLVDALPGDVHADAPTGLWRAVLRRQRGPIALLADHPFDVRSN